MPPWMLWLVPALPIPLRLAVMILFALTPGRKLTPSELDRAGARAIILPMAGFSFSALLALVVLDASRTLKLQEPILLLLLSFLGYYSSLSLQSYKLWLWQDQLGTALREAASGWLLFSVVAIVNMARSSGSFAPLVTSLAVGVWSIDVLIRISIDFQILKTMEQGHDKRRSGRTREAP